MGGRLHILTIWPRRWQRSAFLALPSKLLNEVIQESLKREVIDKFGVWSSEFIVHSLQFIAKPKFSGEGGKER